MAHTLTTGSHIQRRLQPIAVRLRLRDTLLLASKTLWIGVLGSALLQIIGRFFPIPNLLLLSLIPVSVWLLVILGYMFLRPLPMRRVAQRVDSMFDLRERLATALELDKHETHHALDDQQQADARYHAEQLRPRMVSLQIEQRPLMMAAVPLVIWGILAFLPNPQDLILQERAAVQEAVQQTADQIEELQQQTAQDTSLTQEERAELERQLAELERQLRENQGNREQALADLSTAEARLQQRLDPNTDSRQAALEQLSRNLQSMSGQPATQQPSMDQASQQLRELAEQIEQMTPEEQQSAAENLNQQASQMSQSAPQTAQSLSEAADALQQGNTQHAQQSLEDASRSVEQAEQQQANQQAVERSLSEVQEAREQIAQSGQQQQGEGQQGEGQEGEGQEGEGQQGEGQEGEGQQGEGQQGEGQEGGQQGGGQQGGGTDASNLGEGEGGQSDIDPNQGDDGTGHGSGESDLIYQPFNPDGELGNPDTIQGEIGEDGETQTQQGNSRLPGATGDSRVPYQDVLPEYTESAGEALDQSAIPPHLKDYVRDYFSELEPER
ncbi:MAG: hypothetical protein GFH25_541252n43 [Chloroflexi bacterium AL-N10]|nr:hypothetical protein [Chloroflexi bacterium AL-N10]NOK78499.1 hypothetical protein [Chloroflexi bacterium AL-N5]